MVSQARRAALIKRDQNLAELRRAKELIRLAKQRKPGDTGYLKRLTSEAQKARSRYKYWQNKL